VFRRRRRDGKDDTGLEPGDADYPAAEDELAEQDDAGAGWADDEWADSEWADTESADEEDAAAHLAGAADAAQAEQAPAGRADLGDPATWTRLRDSQTISPAMIRSAGPWDGAGEYPDRERIDFGRQLVPVREGYDVQGFVSE